MHAIIMISISSYMTFNDEMKIINYQNGKPKAQQWI